MGILKNKVISRALPYVLAAGLVAAFGEFEDRGVSCSVDSNDDISKLSVSLLMESKDRGLKGLVDYLHPENIEVLIRKCDGTPIVVTEVVARKFDGTPFAYKVPTIVLMRNLDGKPILYTIDDD